MRWNAFAVPAASRQPASRQPPAASRPGDPAVIAALLRTLVNGNDAVRAAAAECLGWVALRADVEVLAALAK